MAAFAPFSLLIFSPNSDSSHKAPSLRSNVSLQRSDLLCSVNSFLSINPSSAFRSHALFRIGRKRHASCINCSATNKSSLSSEISSTAKIRSEVLSPFRSVRMFFYLAFIASGALGGLIAITQLASALANPSKTLLLPEILKGLGIDLDGQGDWPIDEKRKKLWQLKPVNITEWSNWIDEQKKLAAVSLDSPVYISLRMDGRVRGSGVGYPPWNALIAQLPPVKGLWSGILDGMDGRVL